MKRAVEFVGNPDVPLTATATLEKIGELVRTSVTAADWLNATTARHVQSGSNDAVRLAGLLLPSGVLAPSSVVTAFLAEGTRQPLFYDAYLRYLRPFFRSFMETLLTSWLPPALDFMREAAAGDVLREHGAKPVADLLAAVKAALSTYDGNRTELAGLEVDVPEAQSVCLAFAMAALNVSQAGAGALTSFPEGAVLLSALDASLQASDPRGAVLRGYLCVRFFRSPRLQDRIFGTKLLAQWATSLQRAEAAEDAMAGPREAREDDEALMELLSSGAVAVSRPVAPPPAEAEAEAAAAGAGAAAAPVGASGEAAPPALGSPELGRVLQAAAAAAAGRGTLTCSALAAWVASEGGLDFSRQLMGGSLHSSIMQVAGPVVGLLARTGCFGRPQIRTVFRRALEAQSGEATNLRQLLVDVAANGPLQLALWMFAFIEAEAGGDFPKTLELVRLLAAKTFRRAAGADELPHGGPEAPGASAGGGAEAGGAEAGAASAAGAEAHDGAAEAVGTLPDAASAAEVEFDAAPAAAAQADDDAPRFLDVDGVRFDRRKTAAGALDDLLFAMIMHPSAPQVPCLSLQADPMGERGVSGTGLDGAMAEAASRGPFTFRLETPAGAADEATPGDLAAASSDAGDEGSAGGAAGRGPTAQREVAAGLAELTSRLVLRAREAAKVSRLAPMPEVQAILAVGLRPLKVIRESLVASARAIAAAGLAERHPDVIALAHKAILGTRLNEQNRAREARGMPAFPSSGIAARALAATQGIVRPDGDGTLTRPAQTLMDRMLASESPPLGDDAVEEATGVRPPAALVVPGPDGVLEPRLPCRGGRDPVLRAIAVLLRVLVEPQVGHVDSESVGGQVHLRATHTMAETLEALLPAELRMGVAELLQAEAVAEAAARDVHQLASARGRLQGLYAVQRLAVPQAASQEIPGLRDQVLSLWSHGLERTPAGRQALFEYLLCVSGGLAYQARVVGDLGGRTRKALAQWVFDDGHGRNDLLFSEGPGAYGDLQVEVKHLTWFASLIRSRATPHAVNRAGLTGYELSPRDARLLLRVLFGPGVTDEERAAADVAALAPPARHPLVVGARVAGAQPDLPEAVVRVREAGHVRPCQAHELGSTGARAMLSLVVLSNVVPSEDGSGLALFPKGDPTVQEVLLVGRDGAADVIHVKSLETAFQYATTAELADKVKPPAHPEGSVRVPPGSTVLAVDMSKLQNLSVAGMDVLRHVATNGSPDVARLASDWLFQLFLLHRPYSKVLPVGERAPQSSELVTLRARFRESVSTALSPDSPASERARAIRVMSRAPDAIELFLDTLAGIGEAVPLGHAASIGETASSTTALLGALAGSGGNDSAEAAVERHLQELMEHAAEEELDGPELGQAGGPGAVAGAAASASASLAARGTSGGLARQSSVVAGVAGAAATPDAALTGVSDPPDCGCVPLFRPTPTAGLRRSLAPLAVPEFSEEDFDAAFLALGGSGDDHDGAVLPAAMQLRLWHLLMRLPTSEALGVAVMAPADADWQAQLGSGGWKALYTMQTVSSSLAVGDGMSSAQAGAAAGWAAEFTSAGGLGATIRCLLSTSPSLDLPPSSSVELAEHPVERTLLAAGGRSGAHRALARLSSSTEAPPTLRQSSASMGSADMARRARRAVAAAAAHIIARSCAVRGTELTAEDLAVSSTVGDGAAPAEAAAPAADATARRLKRLGVRLVVLLSEVVVDTAFEDQGAGSGAKEQLTKASKACALDVTAALWDVATRFKSADGDAGDPGSAHRTAGAALGSLLFGDEALAGVGVRHVLRSAFLAPSATARRAVLDGLLRPLILESEAARRALTPVMLTVLASLDPTFAGGDAIVELLGAAARSDGGDQPKQLAIRLLALLASWHVASGDGTVSSSGPATPALEEQQQGPAEAASGAGAAAATASSPPLAASGRATRPVIVACMSSILALVKSGGLAASESFPSLGELLDAAEGHARSVAEGTPSPLTEPLRPSGDGTVLSTLTDFLFRSGLFVPELAEAGGSPQPSRGSVAPPTAPLCLSTEERRVGYELLENSLRLSIAEADASGPEARSAAMRHAQEVIKRVGRLTSGGGSLLDAWESWAYDPDAVLKSSTGYAGIVNLSCTCYINSVVQQLFAVPRLRDTVLAVDAEVPAPKLRGPAASAAAAAEAAAAAANEEASKAASAASQAPANDGAGAAAASAAGAAASGAGGGADEADGKEAEEGELEPEQEEDEETRLAREAADAEAAAAKAAAQQAEADAKARRDAVLAKRVTFMREHRLLHETQRLFLWLKDTKQRAFKPTDLVNHMRVLGFENIMAQNDAGELLRRLLDKLEGSMTSPADIFGVKAAMAGQYAQYVDRPQCCGYRTLSTSISYALELPTGPEFPTLRASLDKWAAAEAISDYNCDRCGKKGVTIAKTHSVRRLPDSLLLNLNRSEFNPVTMQQSKVNSELRFPQRLDMARYSDWSSEDAAAAAADADGLAGVPPARPGVAGGPDVFELTGVVIHRGTHSSGHYFSFIKAPVKVGAASKRGPPAAAASASAAAAPAADGPARQWMRFDDASVTAVDVQDVMRIGFGGMQKRLKQGQNGWYDRSKKAVMEESNENAVLLVYSRAGPASEGARLGDERFLARLGQELTDSGELSKAKKRRAALLDTVRAATEERRPASAAAVAPAPALAAGAGAAAGTGAGIAAAGAARSADEPAAADLFPPDEFELVPAQELLREEADGIAQANRDTRVVAFRFDAALAGFLASAPGCLPRESAALAARGGVAFFFDTVMRSKGMDGPDSRSLVRSLVREMEAPGPAGAALALFTARFVLSQPSVPGSVTGPEVLEAGLPPPSVPPLPDVAQLREAAAASAAVDLAGKARFTHAEVTRLAAELRGASVVAAALGRSSLFPRPAAIESRRAAQCRLVDQAVRLERAALDFPEATGAATAGAAVARPLPDEILAAVGSDPAAHLTPAAAAALNDGLGEWSGDVWTAPDPATVSPGLACAMEARRAGFDKLWLTSVLAKNRHNGPRRRFAELASAAICRAADGEGESEAVARDLSMLGVAVTMRTLAAEARAAVNDADAAVKQAVRDRTAANRALVQPAAAGAAAAAPTSAVAAVKTALGIRDATHAATIRTAAEGVLEQGAQLREIMPDLTECNQMIVDSGNSVTLHMFVVDAARRTPVGKRICAAAAPEAGTLTYQEEYGTMLVALCNAARRVYDGATMDDVDPANAPAASAAAADVESKEADAAEEEEAPSPEEQQLRADLFKAEARVRRLRARLAAAKAAAAVAAAASSGVEALLPFTTSVLGTAAAALERPLRSSRAMTSTDAHWPEFFRVLDAVMLAQSPGSAPAVQWPPAEAAPLASAVAIEMEAVRRAVLRAELEREAGSGEGAALGTRGRRAGAALRMDAEAIEAVMRPWAARAAAVAESPVVDAADAASRCGLRFMPGSLDWRAAAEVAAVLTGPGGPCRKPGALLLAGMGAAKSLAQLVVKERYTKPTAAAGGFNVNLDPAVRALGRLSDAMVLPDASLFRLVAQPASASNWLNPMMAAAARSIGGTTASFHDVGVKVFSRLLLLLTRVTAARCRIADEEAGGAARPALPASCFEPPSGRSVPSPPSRYNVGPLNFDSDTEETEPDYDPGNHTDDDADSQTAVMGEATGTGLDALSPPQLPALGSDGGSEQGAECGDSVGRAAAPEADAEADAQGEAPPVYGAGPDAASPDGSEEERGAAAAAAASASAAAPAPEAHPQGGAKSAAPAPEGPGAGPGSDGLSAAELRDEAFARFRAASRRLRGTAADPHMDSLPLRTLRAVAAMCRPKQLLLPGVPAALVSWFSELGSVGPGLRRLAVRALLRSAQPADDGSPPGAGLLDLPQAALLGSKPGIEYEVRVNVIDWGLYKHCRGLRTASGGAAAELLTVLLGLDAAPAPAPYSKDEIGFGTIRSLPAMALNDVRAELSHPDIAAWWDTPLVTLAPWRRATAHGAALPWGVDDLPAEARNESRPCRPLELPAVHHDGFHKTAAYGYQATAGARTACLGVACAAALLRCRARLCHDVRRLASASEASAEAALASAAAVLEQARAAHAASSELGMGAHGAAANDGAGMSAFDIPTAEELAEAHRAVDAAAAFAAAVRGAAAETHPDSVPPGLRAGLLPAGRRPADLARLAPARVTTHAATDEPTVMAVVPSTAAAAAGAAEPGAAAAASSSAAAAAAPIPSADTGRPAMVEGVAAVPGGPACGAAAWDEVRSSLPEAFGAGLGAETAGVPAGWFSTSDDTEDEQTACGVYLGLPPLRPGHVRRPLRRDAVAVVVTGCGFDHLNGVYVARSATTSATEPVLERSTGHRRGLCLWRSAQYGKEWIIGVPREAGLRMAKQRVGAYTDEHTAGLPTEAAEWMVPNVIAHESGVVTTPAPRPSQADARSVVERYMGVAWDPQRRVITRGPPAVALLGDEWGVAERILALADAERRDAAIALQRQAEHDEQLEAAMRARRERLIGASDPIVSAVMGPRAPRAAYAAHAGAGVAASAAAGRPAIRASTGGRSGTPRRVPPIEVGSHADDPVAGHGVGPNAPPSSTAIVIARPNDADTLVTQVMNFTGCSKAKAEEQLKASYWVVEDAISVLVQ